MGLGASLLHRKKVFLVAKPRPFAREENGRCTNRARAAPPPSPAPTGEDAPRRAQRGAAHLAGALFGWRRTWRRSAVCSRGAAPDDAACAPCRWRQLGLWCVRQERCGHGQLLQRGRCLAWQLWGRSRAHVAGGLQRVQRCGGARSSRRPNGAWAGSHGRRRRTRCQPELQCVWHERCGRVELLQLWRCLAREVWQRS